MADNANAVKQRYQEASYLEVGDAYELMGAGFTELNEDPGAQTTSKKYINDKSSTSSITSYEGEHGFTADQIASEVAIKDIISIGKERKTGVDAERNLVRVDLDEKVGDTSDGKLMIGQLWSDEYVLMDEIPVATQEESGAMSSDDKEKLDNIDVDTLKAELKKYIDQNSSGGVSIDTIYPVGSIYLTMDIKFDPNKSFGGTWEITSEGKALFGADITGQDPDFEVPGLTGGEKTHTLTVDELPEHNHNIKVESEELKGSVWNFVGQNANYGPGNSTSGVFSKGGDGTCFYPSSTGKATGINDGFVLDATHDHTATSGNTGSGTAHNNLPPYQTIVVWQRTA